MQGQQIRLMAFIAAGLGLLVLLVERPWSGGESKGQSLYPDFKAEAVDRIQVINRQDTVSLVRRDPIWLIESHYPLPADTGAVRRALEAVDRFEATQLVSKNTSKFGVFQVDSTGAIVRIFGGTKKQPLEFILGKSTPEGGTYFRPAGEDQVYSSPDRIRSLFVRNARAWQDRKMFDMETAEASRLVVEHGDSTIVFEKNAEGTWSLTRPESFAVKPEEMESLLRNVCKLIANAFPDSAITIEEAGLAGKPMLRVKAERLDGSGVELLVGAQDATGLYYAKAADREWIYRIASYRVDPYYKDLASLKAEPPPPAGSPAPADTALPGAAPGAALPAGDARRPG